MGRGHRSFRKSLFGLYSIVPDVHQDIDIDDSKTYIFRGRFTKSTVLVVDSPCIILKLKYLRNVSDIGISHAIIYFQILVNVMCRVFESKFECFYHLS